MCVLLAMIQSAAAALAPIPNKECKRSLQHLREANEMTTATNDGAKNYLAFPLPDSRLGKRKLHLALA